MSIKYVDKAIEMVSNQAEKDYLRAKKRQYAAMKIEGDDR